jgi:hypothetical protein
MLLKPRVQFFDFVGRERSDGAFNLLDSAQAHGNFILSRDSMEFFSVTETILHLALVNGGLAGYVSVLINQARNRCTFSTVNAAYPQKVPERPFAHCS